MMSMLNVIQVMGSILVISIQLFLYCYLFGRINDTVKSSQGLFEFICSLFHFLITETICQPWNIFMQLDTKKFEVEKIIVTNNAYE